MNKTFEKIYKNKTLEGKSNTVILYVLDDGIRKYLMSELEIRERARDLSEAEYLPSIEGAIEILCRFYDEQIETVEVVREDLIYFAYEAI